MSVVHFATAEALAAELQSHPDKIGRAVHGGLILAAHRGRSLLVRLSPVDLGQFKNSWRVRTYPFPVPPTLLNDAPHAGIIEVGARPHGVNREGIEALTKWARRHLAAQRRVEPHPRRRLKRGQLDADARSMAFAIAAKLKKEGQRGRFIVRDNVETLGIYAGQEVLRQISAALGGR